MLKTIRTHSLDFGCT